MMIFRCDGCGELIEDLGVGHIHSISYFETIDGAPQMAATIILHYHDECFASRRALDPAVIDPLRGGVRA